MQRDLGCNRIDHAISRRQLGAGLLGLLGEFPGTALAISLGLLFLLVLSIFFFQDEGPAVCLLQGKLVQTLLHNLFYFSSTCRIFTIILSIL